ncbi:MAG TPA: ATP F0F1 synthase subunit B [Rhizomicrobium sp.]|nr:ATP F0F1 synthase subunit B [Rhizomicrobium sp.]
MELLREPEFWVGVGFILVICLLLWKRVPAMVGGMLDARADVISKELHEAQRLRHEAEALLVQYQRKAADAEKEAAAIVTDAKAEAERFAAESRTALTAQIDRRARQAQDKIAQAEASAIAEIRMLAADAATAAAEKLIAARMDERRAASLVSDGIAKLSEKLN